MKLRAALGYLAAGLTLLTAVLTPFVLMGIFAKGVTALGLHVDEMFTGGPKVRTIDRGPYTITIHRTVSPHMLQNERPFVQLDWSPVDKLPAHISDPVDIDGDGRPDVRVEFDVPADAKAVLRVNAEPQNSRYEAMRNVGKEKNSRLIVRVDDAILVRIPVVKP